MKKTIIITLTLVIAISDVSFANKDDFSFNFSSMWRSKYVGSSGSNFYNDPVIQSSITIVHKSGMYFDILHSGEFGSRVFDRKNSWASEIDYTLGWAGKVGKMDLDLGISYWDCGDLFDREDDVVFGYLKLSKTFDIGKNQTITPYIKPTGFLLTDGSSGDGFAFSSGICHNIDINEKLSMSSEAAILYGDGAFGTDKGFVGRVGVCLNWKLSENLILQAPSIMLYTPMQSLQDERKTELVLGTGISYKF